jgi:hypothetical protein
MIHTDKFWGLFWACIAALAFLYLIAVVALVYLYNPIQTADAAAVGAAFNASQDPFQTRRPTDLRPPFKGAEIYTDSLPIAFGDWSWGVNVDWASSDAAFSGSRAIKIQFLQEWAGARIQASPIDISDYKGISLTVFPDKNVGDVYLTLFDASGRELGRQSLAWYASGKTLLPSVWTTVTVPFSNLFPQGQSVRPITGLSVGSDQPGTLLVDEIRLEKNALQQDRWREPVYTPIPEKPVTPIGLPYKLSFVPESAEAWRTVYGRFSLIGNGIRLGPIEKKTNGSMSYLAGAKTWTDYRVDTTLYWGQTSAFSILVRFADDGNFVSCAFSRYNELVQLYVVQNGVSRLVGTSPSLPVKAIEAWNDAKAGASVQGSIATCFVDGEAILSYDLPDMQKIGGIGFETWTQNTYDSPHTLQALSVSQI